MILRKCDKLYEDYSMASSIDSRPYGIATIIWDGSTWEWKEIQPILCEQCAALMELHDLMIADPEIEVYFYDSY